MSANFCTNLYGKTMGQPLPSRELTAFKGLPKLLDQKLHAKALKAIDGILKKCPDHGETLAMKAFILRSQYPEKKEEPYELLKKALAKDIRSYLCWHVYAMLKQQDRQWTEAVKCYRNALRSDENNVKMLRELASLLIQARDTAGFVDVRQKLFKLEPGNRVNWMALAVAQYLHEDYEATLKLLQAYETATENTPTEPHIQSEFQLFKNTVIEKAESAQNALAHLEKVDSQIPDKLTYLERKVELCLKADKHTDAERVYRDLLRLNPENYNYYSGLRKAMGLVSSESGLTPEQTTKLQATFAELHKLFPRATAPKRLVLDFLEGEAFTSELANYVRPRLRSGKPSLFSELKSLYRRNDTAAFLYPDKVQRIEQLFEGYLESLRTHKKFDASETREEIPSSLVFALLFAAQHFDVKGDTERALKLIEEAISHTPTLINLYVAKARIYKHAGNYQEASAQMELARKLDLADRYLNTVSTKYLLRAGQKEQAEATAGLFTKWDAAGQSNLYEMQASWYELSLAAAYRRAGDLPNAITQYGNVLKHFQDFDEDQLDFHAYCVRKMTLRAYLDLLRWEDQCHSHRFYYRAATGLIECYLEWLTNLECGRVTTTTSPAEPSEKDKEETKRKDSDGAKEEVVKAPPTVDMSKVDALREATKLVQDLEKSNADKLQTHVLAVRVYLRAGQYASALAALKKAVQLEPNHPDTHRSLVRFFHGVAMVELPSNVKADVDSATSALLGSLTVDQANDAFLAKHSASLRHVLAGAEMRYLLGGAKRKQEAVALLRVGASDTLSDVEAAHHAILTVFEDADAAELFRQQAHQRFPLASSFAPASSAPAAEDSPAQ